MLLTWLTECWEIFWDSAIYVLFGIGVAGLIRAFISPSSVANHLGKGRVGPVFKAALWGIPLPLCSCGVLPAAAGLRKQGATTGATTSFLISTPESGVDSIAVSYAMLDPFLTIARPLAGFITAISAGLADTFINRRGPEQEIVPDLSCPVDGCCDGKGCPDEVHRNHHTRAEKLRAGMKYALGELWGDLAGWFFIGMLLAGLITALLPPDVFSSYLGGGLGTMLIMLAVGIPIYICATSSTPIAAALILKGVSPGAALVFLLAGPATNITSLTVLYGLLGQALHGHLPEQHRPDGGALRTGPGLALRRFGHRPQGGAGPGGRTGAALAQMGRGHRPIGHIHKAALFADQMAFEQKGAQPRASRPRPPQREPSSGSKGPRALRGLNLRLLPLRPWAFNQ